MGTATKQQKALHVFSINFTWVNLTLFPFELCKIYNIQLFPGKSLSVCEDTWKDEKLPAQLRTHTTSSSRESRQHFDLLFPYLHWKLTAECDIYSVNEEATLKNLKCHSHDTYSAANYLWVRCDNNKNSSRTLAVEAQIRGLESSEHGSNLLHARNIRLRTEHVQSVRRLPAVELCDCIWKN